MLSLVSIARLLTLLAVLGLGLAGGVYAHGDPPSHTHAGGADHSSTHDHSQIGTDCCDSSASEVVHCGANLLAVVAKQDLFLPGSSSVDQIDDILRRHGFDRAVEPPPPRSILA